MHFSGGSDAVMRKQTVWDPYTVSCCHLKSRSDGSTWPRAKARGIEARKRNQAAQRR